MLTGTCRESGHGLHNERKFILNRCLISASGTLFCIRTISGGGILSLFFFSPLVIAVVRLTLPARVFSFSLYAIPTVL
jgi:hypothetical protein